MLQTIISTLIGILVGGFITWLAAMHYYEKASSDLVIEAEKLKNMNTLILQSLEHAGLIEFSHDDDGTIRGFIFTAIGRGSLGNLSGSAEATFVPAEKQ